MLPVIQSLWIGKDLTQVEKLCIQSYLDHGHKFHLYTYADIGFIPEGTIIRDGNEILDSSHIFQNRNGSYAQFSDWFRYALLVKKGGFWVDMDVICIKPFNFCSDIILAGDSGEYTTAVIGMPVNHPLMVTLEKTCRDYKNKDRASWGAIGGPVVLTKLIREFEMERYGKPYIYFCPWGCEDWQVAFDRTFCAGVHLSPNTFAIHLYNEMGRKIKLDKNARFDADSLIEQLKNKHRIAPIQAKRITSTDLHDAVLQRKLDKAAKRKQRRRKKFYVLASIAIATLVIATFFFV